jgi:putative ABC transport system permease protein
MRWLCWLALRGLWSRRWRSLLSLSALALSVGLVVATGSIGALMQASVVTPARLLGRPADLWIASAYDVDYDLPARMQAQVAVVPGVAEVQPVLRRPVRVQTPHTDTLTLLGVDPGSYLAFHDLALAAGTLPSTQRSGLVALAPWAFIRGLGLGRPVTVTTPSGDLALPLAGLIEVQSLAAAQQGLVLVAPLETVADLFGVHDALTLLEVRLAPAASPRQVRAALERALGPAYAVSIPSQPGQSARLWQRLVVGALVCVDGLVLAGSVSLVYAVFASAARARRRQIGLLRVVGAERWRVLALLVVEAALLGLAGSGLGLVAGALFAWGGAGLVLGNTSAPAFAPSSLPALPPLPPTTLLGAAALGTLASLAGALGPALGAARQPPLEALRPVPPVIPRSAAPPPVIPRSVASPLVIPRSVAPPLVIPRSVATRNLIPLGSVASPPVIPLGSVASPLVIPRSVATRNLVRQALAWIRPRAQACARAAIGWLFPAEAPLALASLAREWRRAALMTGLLALVLGMALGNVGVLSLLGDELATTFGRLAGGDYLVLPGLTTISLRELAGQDTSDVPPLDAGLLAALEGLSDRVWLMRGTTADVAALQVFPGQPTLLLDVEGYARMGGFRFQAGDWPRALAAFRQGPALLLTPIVARRLNVGLGEQVRLDTLQGSVDFRVAGIGESEFTTCILDLADGATYFGANEVNGVEVQVRPGADAEAVRRALLDAVQTHGGTLLSLSQATAQVRQMFHQARLPIGLLIGLTGLVAALGTLNAMLASVAERRWEIGLLRAVGATRRQVARLVLAEAALVGTAAALVGTVLGWVVTLLFLALARTYLGLTVQRVYPSATSSLTGWLPLLAASAAGLLLWPLLTMAGGIAPALHAAHQPIVQASQDLG